MLHSVTVQKDVPSVATPFQTKIDPIAPHAAQIIGFSLRRLSVFATGGIIDPHKPIPDRNLTLIKIFFPTTREIDIPENMKKKILLEHDGETKMLEEGQ